VAIFAGDSEMLNRRRSGGCQRFDTDAVKRVARSQQNVTVYSRINDLLNYGLPTVDIFLCQGG